MKKSRFYPQVKLLLDVLPYVAKEKSFALKGGTAINLFIWDFPRLSVDIDLTYLGDEPRDVALRLTEEALYRIKTDIEKKVGAKVSASSRGSLDTDVKLFVSRDGVQIKIEANPVMRGTLNPAEIKALSTKVSDQFEVEVDMLVSSMADLFGGKIAAALDRQHPRDLFDVKLLFENEGLTEEIKNGFITYLLCHKRPPHEILKPSLKNQKSIFDSEFSGMSEVHFSYEDFESTRDKLIQSVNKSLSEGDKKFLLSFFSGKPDWSLSSIARVQDLAAVKWKLQNLAKMDIEKRMLQLSYLEKCLL